MKCNIQNLKIYTNFSCTRNWRATRHKFMNVFTIIAHTDGAKNDWKVPKDLAGLP